MNPQQYMYVKNENWPLGTKFFEAQKKRFFKNFDCNIRRKNEIEDKNENIRLIQQ